MDKIIDWEFEEAVKKGKKEVNQDYILTDYPGIILRTYKPSVAILFQRRGVHMKKFHPEKRIVGKPPETSHKIKILNDKFFSNNFN